ncbi:MAG: YfiR family protein [Pedosphaera sp.]|nr:YfiR family protein [Pedosphaera sp.]
MAVLGNILNPSKEASNRRFTHRLRACLAGFIFLLLAINAPAQISREYQLKAVFLYNFAQFTEWPPDAFADPQAPLVIGVLGRDPFGAYLDEAVRGEKINGRPLIVQRYSGIQDVQNTHILFISDSESKHLLPILASLQGRSILTVSDMEDFVPRGGMVRFLTTNNKIQLKINVNAVKAARLSISSKILRSAEIFPPAAK